MLYIARGRNAVSSAVYPDLTQFWMTLPARIERRFDICRPAVAAYLQLDDVSFAYLCDPKIPRRLPLNGDDPAALPQTFAKVVNAASMHRELIPAGRARNASFTTFAKSAAARRVVAVEPAAFANFGSHR